MKEKLDYLAFTEREEKIDLEETRYFFSNIHFIDSVSTEFCNDTDKEAGSNSYLAHFIKSASASLLKIWIGGFAEVITFMLKGTSSCVPMIFVLKSLQLGLFCCRNFPSGHFGRLSTNNAIILQLDY